MAFIEVDVDLDGFKFNDIVDEFQNRINRTLTDKQKEYISECVDDCKRCVEATNEIKV